MVALETHQRTREALGLPAQPPKTPKGIPCTVCAHECIMGVGEMGYCGLRLNKEGRLVSLARPDRGLYYAYLDAHVTNCCAAWFCPAGTGVGYPEYACRAGPEAGYFNLAIFLYGCNFDCLFCQNFSHKEIHSAPSHAVDDLVNQTLHNKRITCWCFFGGSPEPQLPYAIHASRRALEAVGRERVLRICFEWNGAGNPQLVRRAAALSLMSGGNIKFDLKCWNETLSYALSGVSNRRAYENFAMIAREFHSARRSPPVLTATTLLVPGYVDAEEVEGIANFIANADPAIPYSLLIFHPDFLMRDLPSTPLSQAVACYRAATRHLERVSVGNLPLLGFSSMESFLQHVAS